VVSAELFSHVTVIILAMVMGDVKFAVCMCFCVPALNVHLSQTAERIWLKFCMGMDVCHGYCVLHFGEVLLKMCSTVLLFGSHYRVDHKNVPNFLP